MNNKTLLGIIIAAVVVIILIVVGTRSKSTPMVSPTPTVSVSVGISPSVKPVGSPVISKTLTYAEALKKYSTTRIQFDPTCQAHPSAMVIKKGTSVMLDNRSPKARTVTLGSVKYALAGYGFRIVVPTAKTLPATVLVDCGTSQNVATITIQN